MPDSRAARASATPAALDEVYVRARNGDMVPITAVATQMPGLAPSQITHENQYTTMDLSYNLAPNVSMGEAKAIIDATLQTASKTMVGKPVAWTNPANGKNGAVTIIRQGYTRDGKLCQEFHLVASKGVVRAQQVGKACRESGKWSPEGGYTLGS